MQVNLIHSILVFQKKNIVPIIIRKNLIQFKLVFFIKKKLLKKLTIKKNSYNYTVHIVQL